MMLRNKSTYIVILVLMVSTLACSLSGLQKKATNAEKTAGALETDVGGIVAAGGSIINTAEALATQNPGILGTVKAVATQGAPLLGTIEAVATYNPGLVQTAQAIIQKEIPTGEPPTDLPLINRNQVNDYIGASQYIFYTTPNAYSEVLKFYQTEMPNNGWMYNETESHEYANAAQLKYGKDNRTVTINISLNPLNNTTVVVININTQ
jgi:hypothetical protein